MLPLLADDVAGVFFKNRGHIAEFAELVLLLAGAEFGGALVIGDDVLRLADGAARQPGKLVFGIADGVDAQELGDVRMEEALFSLEKPVMHRLLGQKMHIRGDGAQRGSLHPVENAGVDGPAGVGLGVVVHRADVRPGEGLGVKIRLVRVVGLERNRHRL